MVTAKKTPATLPPAADADAVAASKHLAARKVPVKAAQKEPQPASAAKDATTQAVPTPTVALSPEQRLHYVEVAAFYIAERRGFVTGDPDDDWSAAEAEVDRLITSGHFAY
jgi:hypothetical protein